MARLYSEIINTPTGIKLSELIEESNSDNPVI